MPSAELASASEPFTSFPAVSGSLAGRGGDLLLVAIQTASNSTLLLAFLMLGLMLLAMFLTHDSLQGLRLAVADPNRDLPAQQWSIHFGCTAGPPANACSFVFKVDPGDGGGAPDWFVRGGPQLDSSSTGLAAAATADCRFGGTAWPVHLLDPLASLAAAVGLAGPTPRTRPGVQPHPGG